MNLPFGLKLSFYPDALLNDNFGGEIGLIFLDLLNLGYDAAESTGNVYRA